jgi:hypothetical protein
MLGPLNKSFLSIPVLGRHLKKVVNDTFPPGPLLRLLSLRLGRRLHHHVSRRWVIEAAVAVVWIFELLCRGGRGIKPHVTFRVSRVPFNWSGCGRGGKAATSGAEGIWGDSSTVGAWGEVSVAGGW